MVEFKHNDLMDRWDVELPSQIGDLKEMVCVATIEGDKITFFKSLDIKDVRSIFMHWDEHKFNLHKFMNKNPLDNVDFELYPDGEENE
ncbi:MAG: hypothetical protein CBD97_01660 [Pelagibacteraceae bacterium TMED237]|nr:MAG: hypothetical protein CBD97_01660 [Pelagibacteraceae bacterium TMED237]|tara:strand:- start:19370 stop:19633 length:264 start_codon:yes stop_codon:yes gene_type:complete